MRGRSALERRSRSAQHGAPAALSARCLGRQPFQAPDGACRHRGWNAGRTVAMRRRGEGRGTPPTATPSDSWPGPRSRPSRPRPASRPPASQQNIPAHTTHTHTHTHLLARRGRPLVLDARRRHVRRRRVDVHCGSRQGVQAGGVSCSLHQQAGHTRVRGACVWAAPTRTVCHRKKGKKGVRGWPQARHKKLCDGLKCPTFPPAPGGETVWGSLCVRVHAEHPRRRPATRQPPTRHARTSTDPVPPHHHTTTLP